MTVPARVVYPLLAAAYSVLWLAANNAAEWVSPTALLRPLGISLAATVLFWGSATFLTRDSDKRAMITFVLVLAFAGFGHLTAAMAREPLLAQFSQDAKALFLLAILVTGAIISTVFSRRSFHDMSRFLCGTTCLLVLFSGSLANRSAL